MIPVANGVTDNASFSSLTFSFQIVRSFSSCFLCTSFLSTTSNIGESFGWAHASIMSDSSAFIAVHLSSWSSSAFLFIMTLSSTVTASCNFGLTVRWLTSSLTFSASLSFASAFIFAFPFTAHPRQQSTDIHWDWTFSLTTLEMSSIVVEVLPQQMHLKLLGQNSII